MTDEARKSALLIVGQTPPPWHGQAVGTKLLFDHDWPGMNVRCMRMAYSNEMQSIGRLDFHKIFHLVHLIREARRFLKRNPGSVLMYPPSSPHWIPFIRDLLYLSCVRKHAAKTVFIFHAGGFGEFFDRSALSRWLGKPYRNPDLCLEVAVEPKAPHEVLGCPAWKWTPYGVDVPEVARSAKLPGAPLEVLFVGSLQEGKGVLEVIRTAHELKERGLDGKFNFVLVGHWFSDEFRDEALALRESLGVVAGVEFPGQKTGGEKWDAYAAADVFFFPSHYESEAFPIVVIEALGSGLPIISTYWRGIPSIVEGSGVARLAKIQSPGEFADALLSQARESDQAQEVAARARAFYLSRYTPAHFLKRVRDALESMSEPRSIGVTHASAVTPAPGFPSAPLEVLQVFNQYLERGGEEVWVDQMLELGPPDVRVRSLRFQSRAWIEKGRPSRLQQARLIWNNPASRRQLREEVLRHDPAVLIFHNILPVGSLGLYDEAAELGIPVVQYIHNFRPFSPSGTLWVRGWTDQSALDGHMSSEVLNGAWEGSYAKTGLLAYYLRRFQKQGRLDSVTRWIAVSDFMRSKFIDAGIPAKRIFTLRHCWQPTAPVRPSLEGDYYLFLGRLVNEKGLKTLLEAWTLMEEELGTRCPRLIIGGTGPEEARVHRHALTSRRVTFAGFVAGHEKAELLSHCRGLIVPSIWWEPLGLTVYEAYDHQRPVLAAMTGGLIETVQHGKTGYHHEPGDTLRLKESILRLEADGPEKRAAMGIAGRQWLERSASPAVWRKELHRLLSEIITSPAT